MNRDNTLNLVVALDIYRNAIAYKDTEGKMHIYNPIPKEIYNEMKIVYQEFLDKHVNKEGLIK